MEIPGAAPLPGTTFGRDLGRNATQIRQSGGFILARSRDPGPNSGPILQPCAVRCRRECNFGPTNQAGGF